VASTAFATPKLTAHPPKQDPPLFLPGTGKLFLSNPNSHINHNSDHRGRSSRYWLRLWARCGRESGWGSAVQNAGKEVRREGSIRDLINSFPNSRGAAGKKTRDGLLPRMWRCWRIGKEGWLNPLPDWQSKGREDFYHSTPMILRSSSYNFSNIV